MQGDNKRLNWSFHFVWTNKTYFVLFQTKFEDPMWQRGRNESSEVCAELKRWIDLDIYYNSSLTAKAKTQTKEESNKKSVNHNNKLKLKPNKTIFIDI